MVQLVLIYALIFAMTIVNGRRALAVFDSTVEQALLLDYIFDVLHPGCRIVLV
jgi:hypothetical protein